MTYIHSLRGKATPDCHIFSATFCPFGCFSFFQRNVQRKGNGNRNIQKLTYSQLIIVYSLLNDDHNIFCLFQVIVWSYTVYFYIKYILLYSTYRLNILLAIYIVFK